jgi:hypothetical protein
MTRHDTDRLAQVAALLAEATAVFRAHPGLPSVGDVEAESNISLLREELLFVVADERRRAATPTANC